MATSVTMPQLGESVTEGTVTRWLKQVGDTVAMDEHNTYALSDTDSPGTPTVYDVHGREVVDISDPDWLDALLRGA